MYQSTIRSRDDLSVSRVARALGAGVLFGGLMLVGGTAMGETFDSGSTGADGDLNLTAPGTVVFDTPDAEGDGVYHFGTINVAAGVTVRLSATAFGARPVVWLASGDVTIDGTLDLRGEDGHAAGLPPVVAIGGAGGFEGGRGRAAGLSSTPGSGPGGAPVDGANHGPGGSHVTVGSLNAAGSNYGNPFLQPLLGGSGGAGGGLEGSGGGGAGGGAIVVASSTRIVVNGQIDTTGGAGGSDGVAKRGGAGSGGSIRLVANEISGTGALRANGNRTRNNSGVVTHGGRDSSAGRVRLEAFTYAFSGVTQVNSGGGCCGAGSLRIVTPGLLSPPADSPSVRVVRVGGEDLPVLPSASFAPADVSIDATGDVVFEIEARNVPLGTVITLRMINETNGVVEFPSTPLAGTPGASTATATRAIPHGFSRFTVEARY